MEITREQVYKEIVDCYKDGDCLCINLDKDKMHTTDSLEHAYSYGLLWSGSPSIFVHGLRDGIGTLKRNAKVGYPGMKKEDYLKSLTDYVYDRYEKTDFDGLLKIDGGAYRLNYEFEEER